MGEEYSCLWSTGDYFLPCKTVPLQEWTNSWAHTKANTQWKTCWNMKQDMRAYEEKRRAKMVSSALCCSKMELAFILLPWIIYWARLPPCLVVNRKHPRDWITWSSPPSSWMAVFSDPFNWCFDSFFFLSQPNQPHSWPIVGSALLPHIEPAFGLNNTAWPRKSEIDARPQN